MERILSATYPTEHLLSFYRRGNREYNNNSNTVTIDNNNQVSIVADTENSDNLHANKSEVHESYY